MTLYLAMIIHDGSVESKNNLILTTMELPRGCEGVMLVFKTKKAAYDFFGKDVELTEIKKVE